MSKRPPRKKVDKEKQKEIIIDMMKADEELGLYDQEFTPDMSDSVNEIPEIDLKLETVDVTPAHRNFDDKEWTDINEDLIGLGVNQIHCGDTVETMKRLKDGTIDMILTSPPYLASIRNDNHKYPGAKNQIKDNQSVEDYLDWMSDVFKEYERVLKDDGVIAFNFSYTTFNPSLPYDLINRVFQDTGLRIYDTVAWKKKSAVPLGGHPNRMTRIVEMVYIFAKTPDFKANKIVKSVSKTGQKYFTAYYNFIEAKNNDGKVEGHEATFSSDLAAYFIDLYTKEGDIVLDNFVGTGTTPYTAAKMDRRYIGIDLVEDYCEYSKNRVSKLYKKDNPDQ